MRISHLFDTSKSGPLTKEERNKITLVCMCFLLDEGKPGSQLGLLVARYEETVMELERKLEGGS